MLWYSTHCMRTTFNKWRYYKCEGFIYDFLLEERINHAKHTAGVGLGGVCSLRKCFITLGPLKWLLTGACSRYVDKFGVKCKGRESLTLLHETLKIMVKQNIFPPFILKKSGYLLNKKSGLILNCFNICISWVVSSPSITFDGLCNWKFQKIVIYLCIHCGSLNSISWNLNTLFILY